MTPLIWSDSWGKMSPLRLLALDLSLVSTGFARNWADTEVCSAGLAGTITTTGLTGEKRLQEILRNVFLLCGGSHESPVRPALVGIEGYAYAARNQAHQIGELGGVIRLMLYQHSIPFVVIPPTTVKQFATGKGNAGKDAVLAEAIRRLDYPGSSHDEADARWILEILKRRYVPNDGLVALPAKHLKAIEGIQWPTIKIT